MTMLDESRRGQANGANGAAAEKSAAGKRPPRPPEPYTPFPVAYLPEPLRDYAWETACALGTDPAYLALPCLAVAAGLIGNARSARLKGTWTEPSVLWCVVVADSGSLKSPAWAEAVDPARPLDEQKRRETDEEMARYQVAREARSARMREARRARRAAGQGGPEAVPPEPRRPAERRAVVCDVTVERLAELLADNPKGLLLARDELSGWLGGYRRYRGRDGGTDLPHWLEMHRAGPILYDRKHGERRSIYVARGAVSVAGTITPGVLAGCLDPGAVEAGLAARLLLAMPPRRPKVWTEAATDFATRRNYARLLEGLAALKTQPDGSPVKLRLTDEAAAAWKAHYDDWGRRQAGADGEDAALLSKLEGAAARLALVHHVCESVARRETAEAPVGLESVEAGVELAKWFYGESRRVYAALRESSGERQTRRLVEFMRQHGGRITARQLHKSNRSRYPTPQDAAAELDALAATGLADWEVTPPGPKGGRPTRTLVLRPVPRYPETDETDDDGANGGGPGDTPEPAPQPPKPPGDAKNTEESEVSGFRGNGVRDGESTSPTPPPAAHARGVPGVSGYGADVDPEPNPDDAADTHALFDDHAQPPVGGRHWSESRDHEDPAEDQKDWDMFTAENDLEKCGAGTAAVVGRSLNVTEAEARRRLEASVESGRQAVFKTEMDGETVYYRYLKDLKERRRR
jgi:hypothetical protein